MMKFFVSLSLLFLAFPTSTASVQRTQVNSVFSEVQSRRQALTPSYTVALRLTETLIKSEEKQLANGKTMVLSLPFTIENLSSDEITTKLSHEWYGGLWPRTDLYAAVKKQIRGEAFWDVQPLYRAGELGNAESDTRLASGAKKHIMVRLNWPGTGSVPNRKLIEETAVGKHEIKFCLIFTANGRMYYAETSETTIELQAKAK